MCSLIVYRYITTEGPRNKGENLHIVSFRVNLTKSIILIMDFVRK